MHDLERAQSLLRGLEDKVSMLDQLAESVASVDMPTLRVALARGENPSTYDLCADSRQDLELARSMLQKLDERMEKPRRCFYVGHELDALGTKRDDGWLCTGFQGGCKSGITCRSHSHRMDRFRCRDCQYDLCQRCLDGWIADSHKFTGFDQD